MENKENTTLFDKIINVFYKIVEFISAICLAGQVLLLSYAVFGRFFLPRTPSWCEELSRVLMVWMALMTSALAVKDDSHVQMSVFDKLFGKVGLKIRDTIYALLNIGFCGVLCWKGWDLVVQTHRTKLAASGLPSSILYCAACAGGLAMAVMLIYKLWRMLCRKK